MCRSCELPARRRRTVHTSAVAPDQDAFGSPRHCHRQLPTHVPLPRRPPARQPGRPREVYRRPVFRETAPGVPLRNGSGVCGGQSHGDYEDTGVRLQETAALAAQIYVGGEGRVVGAVDSLWYSGGSACLLVNKKCFFIWLKTKKFKMFL